MKKLELIQLEISRTLRSLGFFNIEIQTKKEEKNLSVTADGSLRNILVTVMVVTAKTKTPQIKEEVVAAVKRAAESLDREPWSAFVSYDEQAKKVNKIKWSDLSTHAGA